MRYSAVRTAVPDLIPSAMLVSLYSCKRSRFVKVSAAGGKRDHQSKKKERASNPWCVSTPILLIILLARIIRLRRRPHPRPLLWLQVLRPATPPGMTRSFMCRQRGKLPLTLPIDPIRTLMLTTKTRTLSTPANRRQVAI
jgi:hypothetical protein